MIIALSVSLLIGCSKSPPPIMWEVSLYKPDGIYYRGWNVESTKTPTVKRHPDGSSELIANSKKRFGYFESHESSLGRSVPPGWTFVIEKMAYENGVPKDTRARNRRESDQETRRWLDGIGYSPSSR